MTTQIQAIKEKLAELKALDKQFSVFGASRHQYTFNEKLRVEYLHAVEREHNIRLTDEYKSILCALGNGGAGCGYGLERLSLQHVKPPYPGTAHLLRNWDDPQHIDIEMIDSDELSGYIKLFNYGCGMELCLIVTGAEAGDLIFVDCDDRFEKMSDSSLLTYYKKWLDENLSILKRVQEKLQALPLHEVIDSEWALDNYYVKENILSLIGATSLPASYTGAQLQAHLESAYAVWTKSAR